MVQSDQKKRMVSYSDPIFYLIEYITELYLSIILEWNRERRTRSGPVKELIRLPQQRFHLLYPGSQDSLVLIK